MLANDRQNIISLSHILCVEDVNYLFIYLHLLFHLDENLFFVVINYDRFWKYKLHNFCPPLSRLCPDVIYLLIATVYT